MGWRVRATEGNAVRYASGLADIAVSDALQPATVGCAGGLRSAERQAALGGSPGEYGRGRAAGIDQLRRPYGYGRWAHLHRGRARSAPACIRRRHRQRSVDRGTARQRAIDAHDVSMAGETVYRDLRGRARKDEEQDGRFRGGVPAGVTIE